MAEATQWTGTAERTTKSQQQPAPAAAPPPPPPPAQQPAPPPPPTPATRGGGAASLTTAAAPGDPNALLQPWPGVGGFTAWAPGADHCSKYFGHGFDDVFDLVPAASTAGAGSPRLTCRYNALVKTSICDAVGLIVNPANIDVSRGGEPLDAVGRRPDEAELPVFRSGAFMMQATGDQQEVSSVKVPARHTTKVHSTYRQLFGHVAVAHSTPACTHVVKEPTLFLTRYEYANLFHTSTDWYNVVMAARVLGLGAMPIVYLDGHCQSPMDQLWDRLLPQVTHVKALPGVTCYERAVFVPLGYESPLSNGIRPTQQCPAAPPVREFSDIVLRSFGMEPGGLHRCTPEDTRVLFVRRLHYKAHPRHSGRIVRRLANEEAILAALRAWASTRGTAVTVLEGVFSRMSMQEQLAMVQQACVIVGAHGAGLSHILFARPGTQLLEIRTPSFKRPHFIAYAKWAGAGYANWDTPTSSPSPAEVVKRVEQLVRTPRPP